MPSRRASRPVLAALLFGSLSLSGVGRAAEPGPVKIVVVAGSSVYKPGEHAYLAGSAALIDLLRQTPGVSPVLAVDWPEEPGTLADARSIVMFFDGGDKHALLKDDRLARVETLAASGVGLVALHQDVDVPSSQADRVRNLLGATFEKGFSQRAHWVSRFERFPEHPIFRGVRPFTIDDGWLFRLRFVPDRKGITPLLRTVSPKAPVALETGSEDVVAWAYDRPGGGRSFAFTGGHLHRSLAEEGYRRFLVNGILWSAGVPIPAAGAPVALSPDTLDAYLAPQPAPKAP